MPKVARGSSRAGRRAALAAALLVSVVAAACGSTVDEDAAATAAGREGGQFGAETQATTAAPEGALGDAAPVAGTTASTGGAEAGGLKAAGAPGSPTALAMGHGVTASTIEIGVSIVDASVTASAMAAGGTGEGTADWWPIVESVVNYLNGHGGIAGRKIVPVRYIISTQNYLSAPGREQMAQEACALWTQDHHVAAMTTGAGVFPKSMLDCAAKTDTPYITTTQMTPPMPASGFSRYGRTYYPLNWMNAERHAKTMCDGLVGQGFFGKDAKVGVMAYDDPWVIEGVTKTLKPCLQSHGVTVASEVHYPDYLSSPWSSYVLDFQTKGVTHIVWPQAGFGGYPVALFMNAAESQRYRPRYGIGSNAFPSGLGTTAGAPMEQVQNVQGVGLNPYLDVDELTPMSSNAKVCFQILTGAGYKLGDDIQHIGLFYCEALLFMKTAFDRASALNTAGFEASVATLGTGFDDPTAIQGASSFGPTRHDGATLSQDFVFSKEKKKFVYTSPPRPAR